MEFDEETVTRCQETDGFGHFTDNDLTDDGAKAIAEALKVNTGVWYLSIQGDLFKRNVEDNGVVKLALKMDTDNKIGNEGVKALSEVLKVNTKLDYIRLNSILLEKHGNHSVKRKCIHVLRFGCQRTTLEWKELRR